MITINVGFGNKTEEVRNIIKNEALVDLLENKNVKEITIELSPEILKKLSQEVMNRVTEDGNHKTVLVESKIQIEGKIMDCEIVSVV
jgi:hypothetical protein